MEVVLQKFGVFLHMVAQFSHFVFWKEYSFFIKLLMYLCCKSIVCINTQRSHFFFIDFLSLLLSVPTLLRTGLNSNSWNKAPYVLLICSCFLKILPTILIPLFFCLMHFSISFLTSTQQSCWDFDWYWFEPINQYREN